MYRKPQNTRVFVHKIIIVLAHTKAIKLGRFYSGNSYHILEAVAKINKYDRFPHIYTILSTIGRDEASYLFTACRRVCELSSVSQTPPKLFLSKDKNNSSA